MTLNGGPGTGGVGTSYYKQATTWTNGNARGPPAGKKWRVIGGYLVHDNGTASLLCISPKGGGTTNYKHILNSIAAEVFDALSIPIGVFLGEYDMGVASYLFQVTQPYTHIYIRENEEIAFQGGAAAVAQLLIEETEDELTVRKKP